MFKFREFKYRCDVRGLINSIALMEYEEMRIVYVHAII